MLTITDTAAAVAKTASADGNDYVSRNLSDRRRKVTGYGRTGRTLVTVTENANEEAEVGGDPACWAHLVCPECGRFAEGNSAAEGVCAVCGAALPTEDD